MTHIDGSAGAGFTAAMPSTLRVPFERWLAREGFRLAQPPDIGGGQGYVVVMRPDRTDVLRRQASLTLPYRYSGGPWDGVTHEQLRLYSIGQQHCMPACGTPGVGSVWAGADAWPGRERYAPSGVGEDGDTVLMVWRLPTDAEIAEGAARTAEDLRYLEEMEELDGGAGPEDGPCTCGGAGGP